jgi:hypothetical protein
MKTIIPFLTVLIIHPAISGQKKDFRENTLTEISCLIDNAYEFLGKTGTAVLSAGRPASIQGGDKWEIGLVDSSEKSTGMGESIIIGTGCGALTLFVSPKTHLIDVIMYLPHKKAKLKEEDLINRFKDKYTFDKTATTTIETKNAEPFKLSVENGVILIGNG